MLASSCSSDSSAGLVLAEASVAAVFEAVLCRSEEWTREKVRVVFPAEESWASRAPSAASELTDLACFESALAPSSPPPHPAQSRAAARISAAWLHQLRFRTRIRLFFRADVLRKRRGGQPLSTANSRHSPGTPLSSAAPRSWKAMPEPATRSLTVLETTTS